jgi:hypothetical protein
MLSSLPSDPAALAILSLFLALLAVATLPQLAAEPYERVIVGMTVDTGSQVLTLLAPGLLRAAAAAALLAAAAYALVRAAASQPAVSAAWKRLFATEE